MLLITDGASLANALSDTDLDSDLRALLGLRAWQLHVEQGLPFGAGFRLIAVLGGDTSDVVTAALGSPLVGELEDQTSYDWIEDHGLWLEVAYGAGGDVLTRAFVENGPATELGIHYLCLSHFWPDGEGGDR